MQGKNERVLQISLSLLGLTTLASQLLLFRRFLTVFSGNELIIGMLMASWLIMTAAGAFFSRFSPKLKLNQILILQSLLILISVMTYYSIPILKSAFFPYGLVPGLFQTFGIIFLAFTPCCLISGMLFPALASILSATHEKNMAYRAYAVESIGSIAGGLLVSICLWFLVDGRNILFFVVLLNAAGILVILISQKKAAPALISVLLCLIAGWMAISQLPEKVINARLFPQQEILQSIDSPLGSIVVSRFGGEITVFESGEPVITSSDVARDEERVHWAMAAHANPKNVLLVGSSSPGMLLEILKYPVQNIDYVEMNKWLYDATTRFLPYPADRRIQMQFTDPKRFIKTTNNQYDVVLVNMPPPYSTEINRFYTLEFVADIKEHLHPGSIVQYMLPPSGNYLSEEAKLLNSSVYQGLKENFKNVRIIPSSYNFYLASQGNIDLPIISMIREKAIRTAYFNEYYIDEISINAKAKEIEIVMEKTEAGNKDLKPVTYFYYLQYWASMMKFNSDIIGYIVIGLVLILILFLPPVHAGIFTSGFSAAAYELLLLSAIQILYGYVYQLIALVFTLFMAGLTSGAMIFNKMSSLHLHKRFIVIQLFTGFFGILLPLLVLILKLYSASALWIWITMGGMTFLAGLLMGMQFAAGNAIIKAKAVVQASGTYSVDLLGSAGGALLTALLLIPLLGMIPASQSIAGLNGIVALIIILKWRK